MGVFSIFLAVFFGIMIACYWICPKSIISGKQDYVKFLLIYLAIYFALNGIVTLLFHHSKWYEINVIFILALIPTLFVAHLLYPFETVQRNQHLNFFLFFASLLCGCIAIFFTLLHFSNM
ncbi:MAG: hypothetical protein LBT50_06310 [Prevotellaceae bacterium]|jgi:hypothetical protein|nr:hypothetical protein [Prevotellaceae bacterium]